MKIQFKRGKLPKFSGDKYLCKCVDPGDPGHYWFEVVPFSKTGGWLDPVDDSSPYPCQVMAWAKIEEA